jgi:hypothetical protein
LVVSMIVTWNGFLSSKLHESNNSENNTNNK